MKMILGFCFSRASNGFLARSAAYEQYSPASETSQTIRRTCASLQQRLRFLITIAMDSFSLPPNVQSRTPQNQTGDEGLLLLWIIESAMPGTFWETNVLSILTKRSLCSLMSMSKLRKRHLLCPARRAHFWPTGWKRVSMLQRLTKSIGSGLAKPRFLTPPTTLCVAFSSPLTKRERRFLLYFPRPLGFCSQQPI